MNIQQITQSRPSANGFGRRRADRDIGPRNESKTQSAKSSSINSGSISSIKSGGFIGPPCDRVTYIMTHLIGHHVEVQVKNGSIISGIFHGMNVDKDFEIVLKMAQVTKDGSVRGQKPAFDTIKKPQTMIIPSREFVQVIAKDVLLSNDEIVSAHSHEMRKDLMLDSVISHSRNVEVERELEPWMPDEDDPECPELENIFGKTWNRNWDQFETNKTLFGVKSTFNEELYTTKLERGPQMREIEIEASRIAREIEGEETHDSHLAEERGMFFHDDCDLDEESRYSAVRRKDVGGFRPTENSCVDDHNFEAIRLTNSAISKSYSDVLCLIPKDEAQAFSASSSMECDTSPGFVADKDDQLFASVDLSKDIVKSSKSMDEKSSICRLDEKQIGCNGERSFLDEDSDTELQALKSDDKHLVMYLKESSPSGPTYDPSSSGQGNKCSESSDSLISSKFATLNDHVKPVVQTGCSASSTSDCKAISGLGGPSLSPSSSIGSMSSEKSTLNPNAKEFKLNPNAKSFTPSASLRPHVAASEGAIYYGNNITTAPPMHGLPVSMMSTAYGNPHVYNSQPQSGQAYIHPSGPVYGQQQMILGQNRPVYYMSTYSPEMYKGRNF